MSFTEDITERRRNAKMSYNADRSKGRIEISTGSFHYLDDGGDYQEIDPTPRSQGNEFIIDKVPYRCQVAKNNVSHRYQSRNQGRVEVDLIAINGVPVFQLPLNINPQIINGEIVYAELLPGLDIKLTPKRTGVEWFKIIKNGSAPRSFQWAITTDDTTSFKLRERSRGWDSRPDDTSATEVRHRRKRFVEITHDISTRIRDGNRSTFTITETWTGRVIEVVNRLTRQREFLAEATVVYPVVIDADIDEAIEDTADDVYDQGSNADGSAYGVVEAGVYSNNSSETGFRFRAVALAVDATVDVATLTIEITKSVGTPDNDLFGVQKTVPVWSDAAGEACDDITPLTAATLVVPTTTGSKALDVKTIVQEILDDTTGPAWATGDDMGFVTRNQVAVYTGDHYVDIEDLSAAGTAHATLAIDFTAAGGATPKGPFGHPFHGPFGGPF